MDELAEQAAEQMRLHVKERETQQRKQEADKHQQMTTLQDKLNARLKKKEQKAKEDQDKKERSRLQEDGAIKVRENTEYNIFP